jgi:hypothetical protein
VIGMFHGGLGNVRKSAPGRFFALGGCRDGPRDSQKHGLNGAFGVLLFKDFGSVLDLRHEQLRPRSEAADSSPSVSLPHSNHQPPLGVPRPNSLESRSTASRRSLLVFGAS